MMNNGKIKNILNGLEKAVTMNENYFIDPSLQTNKQDLVKKVYDKIIEGAGEPRNELDIHDLLAQCPVKALQSFLVNL